VFLGIMALFSVAAVVTLAGAVVWMLLAEDASPRTGALPGVAFALLVLATVAWKVRGFLRRRVLVGPERLVLRKERGERALDIADIRWIAVAWAWESFRRSPSLLCPNVRIGTATQQWIDLDVDYGAAGRYRFATFDTPRILHELWPLLPWPDVRVDPRVQAYMSSGDGHALDPRDPYDAAPPDAPPTPA
jgi:hypothetical protein